MQSGRPTDAIPCFERTLQLQPQSAVTHHELAMALEQVGRRAEARSHEEKALRLDPNLTEAREFLLSLEPK
jgi:Flp pilus assembly protein TadD